MKTTNRFLKYCMVFFLLSVLFADGNEKPEVKRPNVLFISIDDLNDWIGTLGGHPQVKTPNLDRLAASGTVFTNAYCQSPLCNPSRTSVMTGLRPSTSGIYSLTPSFRTVPKYKNYVSMPKAFQINGYETSSCGKIYHGQAGKGEFENNVGRLAPTNRFPKQKFIDTPSPIKGVDWVFGLRKIRIRRILKRRTGPFSNSRRKLRILSSWPLVSIAHMFHFLQPKSGLIFIQRRLWRFHPLRKMIAAILLTIHGIHIGNCLNRV